MLRNYLAEQNGIPASRAAKDIEAFIADVKGGGGWSEGTDFQGIGHISFQTSPAGNSHRLQMLCLPMIFTGLMTSKSSRIPMILKHLPTKKP
jgi:hypothetical protein